MKLVLEISLGTTRGASREIARAIEALKRIEQVWRRKERELDETEARRARR